MRVLFVAAPLNGPNDGDPGPAVIAAAARVDAEFVLVRPARTDGLPPNVRAVGRVPLDQALPHGAAFIRHSGAGSVLGGPAAGVPPADHAGSR
jgi:UDP:flavonoid glycosyltransferase YjiC (YdhE family)